MTEKLISGQALRECTTKDHVSARLHAIGAILLLLSSPFASAGGIAPEVGEWKFLLCRDTNFQNCSTGYAQCTHWDVGSPTGPSINGGCNQCINQQDPHPWSIETSLLPKVSSISGQSATWNGNWLVPGETFPHTGCWTGAANTLGILSNSHRPIATPTAGQFVARRDRTVSCPPLTSWSTTEGACVRNSNPDPFKNQNQCPVAPTDGTRNGSNPINSFTGSKLQVETDYRGRGPFPLEFTRYFSDGSLAVNAVDEIFSDSGMGSYWGHTYARKIVYFDNGALIAATAYRPEGSRVYFNQTLVNGTPTWVPIDPDVPDSVIKTTDGGGAPIWRYSASNGDIETYDFATGRLFSITNRNGLQLTLSYSTVDGKLSKVADAFGRHLDFAYHTSGIGKGLVASVTAVSDAHGGQSERYAYEYINSSRSGTTVMLNRVFYPDATPGNSADNPRKEYRYNETVNDDPSGFVFSYVADPNVDTPEPASSNFPRFLTGIIDENGQRYATFKYRRFNFSGGYKNYIARLSGHGVKTNGVYADQVKFNYNPPISVDALGSQRTYSPQLLFGVWKQTAVAGDVCASCGGQNKTTTYDPATGFVTSKTDFNNNVTKFKHKTNGLEECKVEAFTTVLANSATMRKTTTQWDDTLRLPTAVTTWKYLSGQFVSTSDCDATAVNWSQVKTTTNSYTNGRQTARTETDYTVTPNVSRTTTYTYTAQGLLDIVDGPRTNVTDTVNYDYDAQGNISQISRNAGATTLTVTIPQYDLSGRALQIIDPNNATTTLTYHPRGWLASRTLDGQTTMFTYDNVGQLDRVTLPGGAYIDYDYDAAHRLTDIKDNLNNLIHYTLDAMGNRTGESSKDPAGALKRQIDRVYNIRNQLENLTVGGAGGQVTAFSQYDLNGNLETTIDPRDPNPVPTNLAPSIYTKNTYDALGRVREVRDTLGLKTRTTLDVFDNPTGITPEVSAGVNGPPTTYTNSAFGDVLTEASPDAGNSSNKYDSAGNRIEHTDGRGTTTTYVYDALNRLTTVNYPNATQTDTVFTYDETGTNQNGKGRLTKMTDEAGITVYKYDLRGNVTEITVSYTGGPQAKTLTFGYDGADRLASIGYPSGRTVNLSRDAAGQTVALISAQSGFSKYLASNVSYAPFGPITGFTFGKPSNSLTYSKILDLSYRPTALTETGVLDLSFTYENAGKSDDIDTLNDALNANSDQSFDYDNLSRLTAASNTGGYGTQSFLYNGIGNRTSQTLNGAAAQAYSYSSGTNRLLSVASGPTFSYDNAGNATTRSGVPLTYDDGGRLSTVNNGTTASYLQNGRGERVKKTSGGQTAYFLYGLNGELLAELNAAGSVLVEYAYLEGEPVAMMTPENPTGDDDADGLINGWEEQYGLNPNSAADASLDSDSDGLTNLQEFQAGTDPTKADTDGDGLLDGADPTPLVNSAAWLVPIREMLLN